MSSVDIYISIISIVIALSGIVTNLLKNGKKQPVKYTADQASLLIFRLAIPFALLSSLLIYFIRLPFGQYELTPLLFAFGLLLCIGGLLLRWAAIHTLGAHFTVKVSLLENHHLKTDGLYTFIRHPSYTGLLLYYLGLALLMHQLLCLAILLFIPLLSVLNRIAVEEKVLMKQFPREYPVYRAKSWRLLPFLY